MDRVYSISQIQAYLGCPLKYRFQYIDQLPRTWRPAALVYWQLHGVVPPLRIDMLLKTKQPRLERFETSRTPGDLAWTARLIEQTVRAIEGEHFYPNPSWRCTECEYFAHCQAWRGRN